MKRRLKNSNEKDNVIKLQSHLDSYELIMCMNVTVMFCSLFTQVRDEELAELDGHLNDTCVMPVAGGSENSYGKVNILLQTYISRSMVDSFSLVSDQAYVAQVRTPSPWLPSTENQWIIIHDVCVFL